MGKGLRHADPTSRCAADYTCTKGGRAYGHVLLPCEMRGPYSGGSGPEDPPPSFMILSVLLWSLRPHITKALPGLVGALPGLVRTLSLAQIPLDLVERPSLLRPFPVW